MLTDAVLNLVYSAINSLIGLIPDLSFDWGAGGAFGSLLTTANVFFPVAEMFSIARLLITLAGGLALIWAIYKVIDWLPFT